MSSTYLAANIKAIRELGFSAAVVPLLTPELKQVFESPNSQGWWKSTVNEDLLRAVAQAHGEPAVEQVGYRSVERSIGPLVMPFLKVMLAVAGADPGTIFSRLGQFSSTSSRGVEIVWTQGEGKRGTVRVSYPERADPVLKPLWHGGLRCGLALLNRKGSVKDLEGDVRTLMYEVAWE